MMTIEKARELAAMLREQRPELADAIETKIAEAAAGNVDRVSVSVSISGRLEKFDGDKQPGQQPAEVIEF